MAYYAVAVGKQPGIYRTWPETQAQVNGFQGAVYKKFATKKDAQAFIDLSQNDGSGVEYNEADFEVVGCCDGSSYKDIGGYGYVTVIDGQIKKYCGPVLGKCTNNIAELTAMKRILHKLRNYEKALIYSDSNYVLQSLVYRLPTWRKNNWKDYDGPVVNRGLLEEIDAFLVDKPEFKLAWVKGHAGNHYNTLADQMANKGRQQAIALQKD